MLRLATRIGSRASRLSSPVALSVHARTAQAAAAAVGESSGVSPVAAVAALLASAGAYGSGLFSEGPPVPVSETNLVNWRVLSTVHAGLQTVTRNCLDPAPFASRMAFLAHVIGTDGRARVPRTGQTRARSRRRSTFSLKQSRRSRSSSPGPTARARRSAPSGMASRRTGSALLTKAWSTSRSATRCGVLRMAAAIACQERPFRRTKPPTT